MNIAKHIEESARLYPERPAILFEGRTISYDELNDASCRAANSMRSLGVSEGDRVALFLPNIPEFAVAYFAAVRLGAIAVSVNPKSTAPELNALLRDCEARLLVSTAALLSAAAPDYDTHPYLENVVIAEGEMAGHPGLPALLAGAPAASICRDVAREQPAAILYTSGTTGEPKGAVLSHHNIDFVMRAKVRYLGIAPEDRLLLFLPLSHCFGQNAVLNAAFAGGATVILHRAFEAGAVLRSILEDRVTMFFGVPTTYILMLEKASREDLAGVRYFFCAAATLPHEVERRWVRSFGSVIHQGYGLTESSPFATYNHWRNHKSGSLGAPIDGVRIAIADTRTGRILKSGERGEILIQGPNVMLGYWNKPEDTKACLRDGWLHTGDVGRVDADGYLTIEDRLKDMVIVGGANVYPAEVERILYQHSAVQEAAVFGKPDAVLGERVCAAIVLRDQELADSDSLGRFCAERLAEFKVPREFEFVGALPKGPTGKILKRVLREQNLMVNEPQRMRAAASCNWQRVKDGRELESRIVNWLGETLEVAPWLISVHRPFSDYGVTSLMAVELAGLLCGWLAQSVPPTIAWQCSTVAALVGHYFPHGEVKPFDRNRSQMSLAQLSEAEAEILLAQELARLGRTGELA